MGLPINIQREIDAELEERKRKRFDTAKIAIREYLESCGVTDTELLEIHQIHFLSKK